MSDSYSIVQLQLELDETGLRDQSTDQNKSEATGVAIFIFRLPWLTITLDTGVMMRDSIPVLAL